MSDLLDTHRGENCNFLKRKNLHDKTVFEKSKPAETKMDASGLGNDYREFVELKGSIASNNLVELLRIHGNRVEYIELE